MTKADKQKQELNELLQETTSVLGGTDQTYIQFLQFLQRNKMLSLPSRLIQGQMVFFKYKPVDESFISRNTYYDSYPLVLVTGVYRGGFEGVNLHFVDSDYRQFLFDTIMRGLPVMKSTQEWRNRILVDYDRLNSRRPMRYFKPAYRKYLWKGMKKRPVIIPFNMWEQMVQSNTSRFINAKPVTVFRESRKRIIRGD